MSSNKRSKSPNGVSSYKSSFFSTSLNPKYAARLKNIQPEEQPQIEELIKNLGYNFDLFKNSKIIIFGSAVGDYYSKHDDIGIAFYYYGEPDTEEDFGMNLYYLCFKTFDRFGDLFDLVNINHIKEDTKLMKLIQRGVVIWDIRE